MITFHSPKPFEEAVAAVRRRSPVASRMSSREWSELETAIRNQAFFSAKVNNVRVIQAMKDVVDKVLQATTPMDLGTARIQLKELLTDIGYQPGAVAGTIQDLSTDQRINLVVKTNRDMAYGRGKYEQGMSSEILYLYPAQELFRAESRDEPRDWPARWREAGGQFFDGRMIALKNDPVWVEISAFGNPYPPFDFNSGMGVRDVDRDTAVRLGLIGEEEEITVDPPQDNPRDLSGVDPELLAQLDKDLTTDEGRVTAGKADPVDEGALLEADPEEQQANEFGPLAGRGSRYPEGGSAGLGETGKDNRPQ